MKDENGVSWVAATMAIFNNGHGVKHVQTGRVIASYRGKVWYLK